jgi:hypothetical protein
MIELNRWQAVRNQIRKLIESKTDEQLLKIPAGLSNNLLWNLGHVVRSMDFLILKPAGENRFFPQELDPYFAKDSSPAKWTSTDGLVQKVKNAEKECTEKMMHYLQSTDPGRKHTEPYKTSMGLELVTLADSFAYNLIHESIHLGHMQIYSKLI